MERSNRPLRDRFVDGVRVFNKYIFNHFTRFIAKRGIGPFTLVIHEGRRSGRKYETPVLVTYQEDKLVIPLPYSDHVDWLQNILSQGGCELLRKKRMIHAEDPKIIDLDAASTMLPAKLANTFRRFEVDQFLRMKYHEGHDN
jgi:hypothetical protein